MPSMLLGALLAASLANVAQFLPLEAGASDWFEAVAPKPGHTLPALGADHFESTRERFELHLQLRTFAPGVTVTLPEGHELFVEHLVGLGHVDAVLVVPEVQELDAGVAERLAPHVVAAGTHDGLGAYAIALPDDVPVADLVLVSGPDRAWFVEPGLLAAAREAA